MISHMEFIKELLLLTEATQHERLINAVRDKKAKVRQIETDAKGLGKAPAPHLATQVNKAKAELRAAEEALRQFEKSQGAEEKQREFQAKLADKEKAKENETEEERNKRWGRAKGDGRLHAEDLRAKHGGWTGLAKFVEQYVRGATRGGTTKVSAADIAHHMDTTTRTIDKWLERPEFDSVARLMRRR